MTNKTIGVALVVLFLQGCSATSSIQERAPFKDREVVSEQLADMDARQQKQLDGDGVVNYVEGLYLGSGESVAIEKGHELPEALNPRIEAVAAEPLPLREFVDYVASRYGVSVDVAGVDDRIEVGAFEYTGDFAGFLDRLARNHDIGWHFDGGTIQLTSQVVRVYEVAMQPGTHGFTARINNQSGGGSEGADSYADSTGGISSEVGSEQDPWEDIQDALEKMLPGEAYFSVNDAFGSVTVVAPPSVQARVADYIETVNEILERQVALNVSVFTLELSDEASLGFNMNAVYESLSDGYGIGVSGPLLSTEDAGQFTASVLEGADSRWEGSTALLRALRDWGETSLVTSTTGVVLNGQEFPITDINRRTYLERRSVNQVVNAGVSAELIPGQVVTGFSMLVSPQILSGDELLLQYSFTLSNLIDLVRLAEGEESIQGPDVDERSFTQRSKMPMGSTLVIAGFQRDEDTKNQRGGATGYQRDTSQSKSLVFVTITANKA